MTSEKKHDLFRYRQKIKRGGIYKVPMPYVMGHEVSLFVLCKALKAGSPSLLFSPLVILFRSAKACLTIKWVIKLLCVLATSFPPEMGKLKTIHRHIRPEEDSQIIVWRQKSSLQSSQKN